MSKEVVWGDQTVQPRMLDDDGNRVVSVGRMGLLGLGNQHWPHLLGRAWKEVGNRVERSGVVPGGKVYDHHSGPWE
jgi:hypothetical protein